MSLRAFARTVIVLAAFAGASPIARAADNPADFVADLGQRAITVLTSQTAETDRERQFRSLFDEGFDVQRISQFVLGPYWRTASEDQRREFKELFESYVVHAYTVRFNEYRDEQFKVMGARAEGDASSLVSSQVVRGGNAPAVKIDWRIGKSEQGFKITDVIVEGISMAVTQRQEFASVIQHGGGQVDALLALLREKTAQR
jgi:phospholipid transport system substrate-binding protein